ncbi:rCG24813 [Rattus norvegicus]|uniref:RCG24813 n=1 Tax=Rattus norvegicus TaxID=10116 RepID=A6JBW5_RAT|nr:rCG24813 [Rattus norvegicus]
MLCLGGSPSANINTEKEKEQVDRKPWLSPDSIQEIIKDGVLL